MCVSCTHYFTLQLLKINRLVHYYFISGKRTAYCARCVQSTFTHPIECVCWLQLEIFVCFSSHYKFVIIIFFVLFQLLFLFLFSSSFCFFCLFLFSWCSQQFTRFMSNRVNLSFCCFFSLFTIFLLILLFEMN